MLWQTFFKSSCRKEAEEGIAKVMKLKDTSYVSGKKENMIIQGVFFSAYKLFFLPINYC